MVTPNGTGRSEGKPCQQQERCNTLHLNLKLSLFPYSSVHPAPRGKCDMVVWVAGSTKGPRDKRKYLRYSTYVCLPRRILASMWCIWLQMENAGENSLGLELRKHILYRHLRSTISLTLRRALIPSRVVALCSCIDMQWFFCLGMQWFHMQTVRLKSLCTFLVWSMDGHLALRVLLEVALCHKLWWKGCVADDLFGRNMSGIGRCIPRMDINVPPRLKITGHTKLQCMKAFESCFGMIYLLCLRWTSTTYYDTHEVGLAAEFLSGSWVQLVDLESGNFCSDITITFAYWRTSHFLFICWEEVRLG